MSTRRPNESAGAAAGRRRGGPILVVSAFEPELAPLRRLLARARIGPRDVACVPVGIGAVEAGVGAARAMNRFAPRMAVFIGTAGSYGARPAIGQAVIARRITLASTAAARGDGYLPGALVNRATTDSKLRAALSRASPAGARVPAADAAAPTAITRGAALARRLAVHTGAAVENLELFGVARAAHAAAVPFGAVLGISNRVGPRAHDEWRRHQEAATEAATTVVARFLLNRLAI
ncbi:MAG: phosphorylase [Pseudomonadota bacterium]